MNEELNLRCNACPGEGNVALAKPDWAIFTAANAEWLDPGTPIPAGNIWTRSDVPPRPGDRRELRVSHPFRAAAGSPFWILYLPSLAAMNGWAEAPETIPDSAFALCRLEQVLHLVDAKAWIRVRIDDVMTMPQLVERIEVKRTQPAPIPAHQNKARARWGNWEVLEGNTEGDLGVWIVALHTSQSVHLLVHESWSFHEDLICVGNLELTEEQWASFSKSF